MHDVLIVGSGPAGLSAAIYTSRAGLSTVVLEGEKSGGLITTTDQIDNYLGLPEVGGLEMAKIFKNHAVQFGAKLMRGHVASIEYLGEPDGSNAHFKVTTAKGDEHLSKTVIYSAGSTPRKLGVEGEELSGVSYCATCDGVFYSDEPVVVVGGGESAVEEAMYLSKICSSVDVLVRGDSWKATQPAVDHLLLQENVTVHMSSSIAQINGEDDDVVSVTLDSGETIEATGVFVAVGQLPNSDVCTEHVVKHSDGFIKSCETPGFFAAGDIANPAYRQAVVAAGDGAKAGIDATAWLLSH